MSTGAAKKEEIHAAVQATYGAVARTKGITEQATGCCGADLKPLSDYSVEELASGPKTAYLGEGSGVPVRFAHLKPGDVVVDLGAGAGMDTFLAANRVGPTGRVHGFDLTPDMLERARRNAADAGYANVTFERADIEHLPLPDGAANAAISNCVINLTPDKSAVYREILRVLKPGGQLSVADIVLRGSAAGIRAFREKSTSDTWCACVSGALEQQEYLDVIRAAGFADVNVVSERLAQSQPEGDVEAVAVTLTARKPA
jgi:SAM-dependent methyltransferase